MRGKYQLNDEQTQRWEKKKVKGKWRYILVYRVLGWGLPNSIALIYSTTSL